MAGKGISEASILSFFGGSLKNPAEKSGKLELKLPRHVPVGLGTSVSARFMVDVGDGRPPTVHDGNPYFMGPYKPLRTWVDEFISNYREPKMMLGRRSFPFGMANFQGLC